MFEAFHNDKIFPVNMTGPDSFELDGQEYTGKPQSAGREFAEGEKAFVVFTSSKSPFGGPAGRRMPVILAGATKRSWMVEGPYRVTVDVQAWLQSNTGSGQNAVGGQVAAGLLDPRNSTTSWDLPTDVETSTLNVGLRPLGLARFKAPLRNWTTGDAATGDPIDVFATCWPRNNAGDTGLCLGFWRVSDRVNLWIADTGYSSSWTNPDYPLQARFFVDSLSGWVHGLPFPAGSSPGLIFSAAAEGLKYESLISRAPSGGQNLGNVSLQSFTVLVDDVPEIQSYICCPAYPPVYGSATASMDFLKMNQSTGEWTSFSSYDVSYIPEGGPSEFPDLIEFGSDGGGPIAWRGQEVVAFCSGGVRDVFDSDKWEKWHWAVRTVKTDGTAGDLLYSKTVTASSSPTSLANASLKTQIMTATHDLQYSTTFPWNAGYWLGGIQLGSDTNSEYAHFQRCPAFLAPASSPNMIRQDKLENRAVVNPFSGSPNWPGEVKNLGGGISVNRNGNGEDTIWFVVFEPEQKLIGGQYSSPDSPLSLTGSEPSLQTYRWTFFERNECLASTTDSSGYRQDTVVPLGSSPTVTPGTPYTEFQECIDIGYPELPGSYRTRNYGTEDLGEHTQVKNTWNQKLACFFRTKLIGIKHDNTAVEVDVTRTLDVDHSRTIGSGAGAIGNSPPATITATELDFPVANNVWQRPMAFDEKGLLLLLRDLHADGSGNNPTPHLEVLNSGGDFGILSTIRLGSYSETIGSDDPTHGWKAGDQLWDPYAFGGPRMKGCLDESGNPLVLILVGESKKVDTATESQFKRVCYCLVNLANPTSPDIIRVALTSPDEGVGASGNVPTDWPLWWEWDTLVLTAGHVAWIKDSKFRESIV